jgi:hypothetical protein
MKTRQDRERELQRMPRETLLELYCRLHQLPPGRPPPPGTLLILGILAKEYPEERTPGVQSAPRG